LAEARAPIGQGHPAGGLASKAEHVDVHVLVHPRLTKKSQKADPQVQNSCFFPIYELRLSNVYEKLKLTNKKGAIKPVACVGRPTARDQGGTEAIRERDDVYWAMSLTKRYLYSVDPVSRFEPIFPIDF
jgi:hypothetical protein